jgi:hypothetical protein
VSRIEPTDSQYLERVGDLFIQELETALRTAAITGIPVSAEQQKNASDWALRAAADQLDEELNDPCNPEDDYPEDEHATSPGAA